MSIAPTANATGLADRRRLAWVALLVLTGILVWEASRFAGPASVPLRHFMQFWSAAQLQLHGGNPYSVEAIREIQVSLGWPANERLQYVMWNPPWTLALVMPFGLLPFGVAWLLWMLLLLGSLLWSCDWLWRRYQLRAAGFIPAGGTAAGTASQTAGINPAARNFGEAPRWIGWAIGFTFWPCLIVLHAEQITPLLLLGLIGFLHFERRGRFVAAGLAFSILATKPHLLYLIWLALLLWSVQQRRWQVWLGVGLAIAAASGLTLAVNPAVFGQYREALASYRPSDLATPTIGSWLRLALGGEYTWLQFLPPAAGAGWLIAYFLRRRRTWNWTAEMPLLVAISLLTTAYQYSYDFVLLVIPVLAAAGYVNARRTLMWPAIAAFAVITVVAWIMNIQCLADHLFVWMVPVALLGFLGVRRYSAPSKDRSALHLLTAVP